MANLKEIRTRIYSVESTMQITSAMKMVSAAKLKRAQNMIIQLRPYANKLTEMLINLSSSLNHSDGGKFLQEREINNVLFVTITSNRGLCGGFNANIIKSITVLIRNSYKNCEPIILSIGKKSSEYFSKNGYNVVGTYDNLYNEITFDAVSKIAENIMNDFTERKIDKVFLVYNQFKNAATQIIVNENYLPVDFRENKTGKIDDYIFEPSKNKIIKELIPKSLKNQLYKAILDSHAAEHGARMTAMHKATDNASELKDDLKLHYNKARQAAITSEILEIVGGAEAINN